MEQCRVKKAKVNQHHVRRGGERNAVSQEQLPCHGVHLQVAHQGRKWLFIYVLQILGVITAIIAN